MEIPSTERIKEFILINHPFMTKSEMAEELNSTSPTIGYHCELMNIKPITIGERVRECIEKFKHLTAQELAIKLQMSISQIRAYAKSLGIELTTYKKVEIEALETNKGELQYQFSQEDKEFVYEATGVTLKKDTPIKRAPPVYTQTGSQLTDELKGIITTERVQVKASDAFFK